MVRVAIALLLLVLLPSVAQAEKRIAFVVGIDKYDNLGPQQQLQRAVNDARSVGAALAPLGFEVVSAENIGRATFNAQWQKFLDKINPGDTAAVYFAGHAIEIEGLNFLQPRDVPNISFGRQEQLKRESLSVPELLLDLRKRNAKVSLLILDACRDNPFIPPELRSLSFGRGLARMDAPNGTFIMYSAGASETALDRLPKNDPDKVNSIYTRRLLPLLKTPGLQLHELARQLRREVHDLAATVPHVQQPAYYDGLIGEFCLAGCGNTPAPKTASSSGITPPPTQRTAVPMYFKCTMKGGLLGGRVYSLLLDAAGRGPERALEWASENMVPLPQNMVPLEIVDVDDLRIHARTRWFSQFPVDYLLDRAPERGLSEIRFTFDRLTLMVEGFLVYRLSSDALSNCRAQQHDSSFNYCEEPEVVVGPKGTCEAIARPEDIASVTPQPKPTPKATASPQRCDGVEAFVGNEQRCLKPKDTFKDCPECPEMVVVPAGEFMMGSTDREPNERPAHKVTIAKPFAVGKFEVTFAEWDACVLDGGCKHKPDDKGAPITFDDKGAPITSAGHRWGRGKRPVINVSWNNIVDEYLRWVWRKSNKYYRLLTETEWEYAARAASSATYSWGNSIGWNRANCYRCGSQWDNRQTAPVGSFDPNAFGVYDMYGNVWEWVQDCYRASYADAPSDGWAIPGKPGCRRVLRGGSWNSEPENLRAASRSFLDSDSQTQFNGFRVARTLD